MEYEAVPEEDNEIDLRELDNILESSDPIHRYAIRMPSNDLEWEQFLRARWSQLCSEAHGTIRQCKSCSSQCRTHIRTRNKNHDFWLKVSSRKSNP